MRTVGCFVDIVAYETLAPFYLTGQMVMSQSNQIKSFSLSLFTLQKRCQTDLEKNALNVDKIPKVFKMEVDCG